MAVYYNEFDLYAAQWLRNLISAGHLPGGDVDERSIVEVPADDLKGYHQAHFFAGIGGWPLALELAGWEGPCWTGSCPCQPFSAAGQSRGLGDERHLWPAFQSLIAECRPSVVFGEQVASKDGRYWLAGVRDDLEGMGYAVGAADLCSAGAGAPHIRQRLFWVAESHGERHQHRQQQKDNRSCGVGHSSSTGGGRHSGTVSGSQAQSQGEGSETRSFADQPQSSGFWSRFDLIPCADGKARRVEPGTFPLAHGVPQRVGQLRAYGNAITPQVAAEFLTAYIETRKI